MKTQWKTGSHSYSELKSRLEGTKWLGYFPLLDPNDTDSLRLGVHVNDPKEEVILISQVKALAEQSNMAIFVSGPFEPGLRFEISIQPPTLELLQPRHFEKAKELESLIIDVCNRFGWKPSSSKNLELKGFRPRD